MAESLVYYIEGSGLLQYGFMPGGLIKEEKGDNYMCRETWFQADTFRGRRVALGQSEENQEEKTDALDIPESFDVSRSFRSAEPASG